MNVAIFASAFHPSLGGVEELVRQLAHEYRRQGITAIVLTNRWPRSAARHEVYEGIPVYRLAMRMPEYNLQVRMNYWLAYPFVRHEMLGILRRHGIDMLHVQCASGNGHYALMAKRALDLPLVMTAQGELTMDAERVYEKSPFMNRMLHRLLSEANYITACSRDTLRDLEEYGGGAFGNRASVVYNGIRLEDFDKAEPCKHPRPYILGIGRLVTQKGFDVLIEAFAKAKLESHDLIIAGDGTERANLETLVKKHGLDGRVRFHGRADRATASALFKGCSFFVLPSRQEPMGIVNLEAMAAGKAVIASRTGGAKEIVVNEETGLLVPPEDASALAGALRRVAGDAKLRTRLGSAGFYRAKNFTWESIAASYRDIYENLLLKKRGDESESAPEEGDVALLTAD